MVAATTSKAMVMDTATGVVRFLESQKINTQRVRVLNVGQYIFWIMPSSNSANINMNRMDCTLPQNLGSNPNGGPQFTDYDFASGAVSCSPFSSTQFFFAYSRGTSIVVAKCGLTGTSVGSVVINETVSGPIAVRYIGTLVWVAWQRAGGDIRMAAYDSAFAPVVAAFTVKAASAQTFTLQIGARTSTSVLLAWDNGTDVRLRAVDTAGALLLTERTFIADHIESGFFEVDGRSFLLLAEPSSLQGGTYLIEVTVGSTPFVCCNSSATLATLVSGALSTATPGDTVSSVVQTSAGTYLCALITKTKITLQGGGIFAYPAANLGADLFEFDLTSGKRFRSVQHGGSLVVAGGTPTVFDGRDLCDVGFLRFPEVPTTGGTLSGGGALADGTYQWVVTYRRDDMNGRVWRSNPSQPITVVVATGTGTSRVIINGLNLSFCRTSASQDGGLRIELWRTERNSSGPFFLVTSVANTPTSAAVWGITDGAADASINTGETLYTSGGQLANFPAPPSTFVVSHRDVLIMDNAEDGSLWQSKPLVVGEGFAFNEALSYRLPSTEKPVAGASMDDKCIIFTEHEIHMLVGEPLDDKGSSGGFQAQRLSSPVGCIDPRSVVVGKDGVFFRSARGIELLTRPLEVVFVGAEVTYWTDNYTDTLFAAACPQTSEIRFGVATPLPGVAETHQILRLNYERRSEDTPFGAWTTELAGMGAARAGAAADGLVYLGYSTGLLFAESESLFTDDGQYVPFTVRMMLKPGGLQGFVRLRRLSVLADRKSSHKLTIYMRYNYDDTILSQRAWSNAEIAALPREQLTMLVDLQKAQAFEIEIQDSADTVGPGPDTGEGCTLAGLAMELGVRERIFGRAMPQEAKK
jgi:hypothetical protein